MHAQIKEGRMGKIIPILPFSLGFSAVFSVHKVYNSDEKGNGRQYAGTDLFYPYSKDPMLMFIISQKTVMIKSGQLPDIKTKRGIRQ